MTQFAFLKLEFPSVYELARKAETSALSDPRGSCFYARLALETAVNWLYHNDNSLRSPYENSLSALIHEGTFRTLVGNVLVLCGHAKIGDSLCHDVQTVAIGYELNNATSHPILQHILQRFYGWCCTVA